MKITGHRTRGARCTSSPPALPRLGVVPATPHRPSAATLIRGSEATYGTPMSEPIDIPDHPTRSGSKSPVSRKEVSTSRQSSLALSVISSASAQRA